jgi:uncharacterized repeat protein (TIGR03803 family)
MKNLMYRFFCAVSLGFFMTSSLSAQVFSNLHNFSKTSATFPYFTNADGANPYAALILTGTNLYGTAYGGGSNGDGAIFSLGLNGAGFTNLHSFTNSSDGNKPLAALILAGTNVFGTTEYGGTNGAGMVFKLNPNGTGLTNLYSFTQPTGPGPAITNADGAFPNGGLVSSGGFLFGTAEGGGIGGEGVIFRINTNGTGFTNLHSFAVASGPLVTNSDGGNPHSGMIYADGVLYGTALVGGAFGSGTIFRMNTNGTGFTNLHSFTVTSGALATNDDGAYPQAGLLLIGGTLYGAASSGGKFGDGTLFTINTNGTGFSNIYNFTGGSDGAYPLGELIFSGSFLYGTAEGGGPANDGTVFEVSTNGKSIRSLHVFTATTGSAATNGDGALPNAALVLNSNTLYGTTTYGGGAGNGTLFSVIIQPQLGIAALGTNKVVLTWPTNFTGYTLESFTNLLKTNASTFTPAPVIVSNLYVVTNTVTNGGKLFYRLIQ